MASQRSNIANAPFSSNSQPNFSNGNRPTTLSPPVSPAPHAAAAAQFNPRLILSQIISLQSFHYVVLGLIFQINHVMFATSITMDRIFTAKYLDIWSAMGWIDNAAVLMSSFIGSLLLALIVEKSKKCLDFSVTLFLIHIILCSIYGGFPSTWDWWIIHIMGMIMMVVLGEYFCSKRELSDIPLLVL
mmetsp:Transcript_36217/g.77229  ORF Transcript_36217/g.77229 Transcript_36217/m.77229 type:complete len:187 (+) Transcript_36217:100-660(+)